MSIERKIYYYKEVRWNILFRELYHTVVTVCEFVKPIYPNIDPLKYIEYFFRKIDFDKIDNNPTKAETLNYCNAIYYGLEQILKIDIDLAIQNYQNNISKLSKGQISETRIKLIELIGNLKRQTRTNEAGFSFTQRYNALYKSIKERSELSPIDYQILIGHFNETIANNLLNGYKIINETLKEVAPLIKKEPTAGTGETKPKNLFDIWVPDRNNEKEGMYQFYINHLKKEYKETASPFVTETNKKLYWNKVPQKGWVQYLAGFIYTCIQKNWIADLYSAPQYKPILRNTFFNINFNIKPFKQLSVNPPSEKYLQPFKNLPANI